MNRYILIGIIFLCCCNLFGQNPSNPDHKDLGLWLGSELQYEVKKWQFGARQELRTKNNSSSLDKSISQLRTRYNFSNKLSLQGALRYTGINDNIGNITEWENHFRYQFSLRYKPKWEKQLAKNLRFSYRLQYQSQKEVQKEELRPTFPNRAWRFRVSADYNIKKWKLDPKISYELFFHRQVGSISAFRFFTGFTRFRIQLETDYKLNDRAKLNFFILKQKENILWRPPTEFMLGWRYIYLIGKD